MGKRKASVLDRLVFLGIIFLLCWPLFYWICIPNAWRYAQGVELQKAGEIDQARDVYQQVLRNNPSHSAARFRLGEIAFENREFEKAYEYAQEALEFPGNLQRPQLINLQTNALLALDRNDQAVESISQIFEFANLPSNYADLSVAELQSLSGEMPNRQFLNSQSYVMALAGIRLEQAENFSDATVGYFENQHPLSRFAAAYLFERSSCYRQAADVWQGLIEQTRESVGDFVRREERIRKLRTQFSSGKVQGEISNRMREQIRLLEHQARFGFFHLAYRRLGLLARKTGQVDPKQYESLAEFYQPRFATADRIEFTLDDQLMVQYAFELQHYYDTRAVVRLKIGESLAGQAARKRDNSAEYVLLCDRSQAYLEGALEDVNLGMSLRDALDSYNRKFPRNTLLVRLESDVRSQRREAKKIEATVLYHRYLILKSLCRDDEVDSLVSRIRDLGFEPDRFLF